MSLSPGRESYHTIKHQIIAGALICFQSLNRPGVLDQKKVACSLWVGGELLPQVEEFKYLGVLFTSEGRMDREVDRRIGAAAAVMWLLYWSVVVKRELSRKAKLLIDQSTFLPSPKVMNFGS